jgi:hypothetical protein
LQLLQAHAFFSGNRSKRKECIQLVAGCEILPWWCALARNAKAGEQVCMYVDAWWINEHRNAYKWWHFYRTLAQMVR